MRIAILAACAGIITATGCGTMLKESAPTTGGLAQRTLALQESLFAIMERSDKPAEAAAGIRKYCDRNRTAIQQLAVDAGALGNDGAAIAAFTEDLAAGLKDLTIRSAEALKGKEEMVESALVLSAIETCNGTPVGEQFDVDADLNFSPRTSDEPSTPDDDASELPE